MQEQIERDKLIIKDGWLICPACKRQRVLHLIPGTQATRLPVYCKRCNKESIVNIDERLSL